MKPHIKPVKGEYWVFDGTGKLRYKCLNMNAVIAMLNRIKVSG